MARISAWITNGFNSEETRCVTLTSTSRACGGFVLSWVMAVLLAGCATAHGPRRVDDRVMPTTWPWSRVGELQPGVLIAISTTSTPLRARFYVSADPSEVTVLNLELPSLAPAAIHALREMATRHPEYFAVMQASHSFEQDHVRLGRDGLFVANRRVAEFAEVVETFPRQAVGEIRGPVVARGSVLGTIIGGWLGFGVGVVPGLGGAKEGWAWTSLAGAVTLGGWLGNRWSSHTVDGVVYRAP